MLVKVDSGAEGNILPLRTYRQFFPQRFQNDQPLKEFLNQHRIQHDRLTLHGGIPLNIIGCTDLEISYRNKKSTAAFYITDTSGPVLVGSRTCTQLGLLDPDLVDFCRIDANVKNFDPIAEYPDRFTGLGKFEGLCHFTTDEQIPPVIHPPRRCPIAQHDEVRQHLDLMQKLQVITSVTEPTDWVSSIAYTRKSNGELRICLDPSSLNKALKRPHYPTKTLDDITHKLRGSTIFSKLDAKSGYWSVVLDKESSLKTTFNTPFGRFRYLRLPFGLSISQDVFQQKMDQIIEDSPGTISIADDIVIYGKDQQEHDRNLKKLMQLARKGGLIFNKSKCLFSRPNVTFFGVTLNAKGITPDAARISQIQQLDPPKDRKQLQEFLGLTTYMSPFIPQLSTITAPLRDLLKKDAEFHWSSQNNTSFNNIIRLICQQTTLAYYDPHKISTLQVDASSRGLGAVLLQDSKPIAFASKSLSPCEQRYANIEREMLAVLFGCEKFHQYLYGTRFIVHSDHKPLEMIILKNLGAAPQRLQRMLLRLQPYQMEIKYKPGKEMYISDLLSRQPHPNCEHIELDQQIAHVQFGPQRLAEIIEETAKDQILQKLQTTINNGWPKDHKHLTKDLHPYWPFRDTLTNYNGIICKGQRIIIPATLRKHLLEDMHTAHLGIVKTKLLAQDRIYWPKKFANTIRIDKAKSL